MEKTKMVEIGALYYSIDDGCTFVHYGLTDTVTLVLDFDDNGYDGWHEFKTSPANPNYGWRKYDW